MARPRGFRCDSENLGLGQGRTGVQEDLSVREQRDLATRAGALGPGFAMEVVQRGVWKQHLG